MPALDVAPSISFLGSRARVLTDDVHPHRVGVVERDVPPEHMPPLSRHRYEDVSFYILDGEVTLYLPGLEVALEVGDFYLVPAGVPHTYLSGDMGARWLTMTPSTEFERFVHAVGDESEMGADRLARVAARYGIDILGPPGARP